MALRDDQGQSGTRVFPAEEAEGGKGPSLCVWQRACGLVGLWCGFGGQARPGGVTLETWASLEGTGTPCEGLLQASPYMCHPGERRGLLNKVVPGGVSQKEPALGP